MAARTAEGPPRFAIAVAAVLLTTIVVSGTHATRETGLQAVRLHTLDIRSAQDLRDFFRYAADGPPLLTAHRGGAREGFPENALATFENTLRHTWANLEVDPRLTKDGIAVLFHDPTLERTSTGTGRVIDHTWDQLRQLELKDPAGRVTAYRIPTLGEALEWAKGKTVLFLDNKDVDVVERARLIQQHDARAWAVVMAYTLQDARRVYEFDPEITMQVFLADTRAMAAFEATGIPWNNVIGFVTHTVPAEPQIFELIARRGAMGILGTSRTIDRAFAAGQITRDELRARYAQALDAGAHVVEADLAVEAGDAIESRRTAAKAKTRYFTYRDVRQQ